MSWSVNFTGKTAKQVKKLPEEVQLALRALVSEMESSGPFRANWKNYSPLKVESDRFHCHLKKGRPTYVACWEVVSKKIRIVEVYYAGTHENAPY